MHRQHYSAQYIQATSSPGAARLVNAFGPAETKAFHWLQQQDFHYNFWQLRVPDLTVSLGNKKKYGVNELNVM